MIQSVSLPAFRALALTSFDLKVKVSLITGILDLNCLLLVPLIVRHSRYGKIKSTSHVNC